LNVIRAALGDWYDVIVTEQSQFEGLVATSAQAILFDVQVNPL